MLTSPGPHGIFMLTSPEPHVIIVRQIELRSHALGVTRRALSPIAGAWHVWKARGAERQRLRRFGSNVLNRLLAASWRQWLS